MVFINALIHNQIRFRFGRFVTVVTVVTVFFGPTFGDFGIRPPLSSGERPGVRSLPSPRWRGAGGEVTTRLLHLYRQNQRLRLALPLGIQHHRE